MQMWGEVAEEEEIAILHACAPSVPMELNFAGVGAIVTVVL